MTIALDCVPHKWANFIKKECESFCDLEIICDEPLQKSLLFLVGFEVGEFCMEEETRLLIQP